MRTDELKLRIVSFCNDIIDRYFPTDTFINKLKNTTAKYWVDQNVSKLDKLLLVFADDQSEIDVNKLREYYEPILFENEDFCLNIKSLIPDDQDILKKILPDKIIVFHRDDLTNLIY